MVSVMKWGLLLDSFGRFTRPLTKNLCSVSSTKSSVDVDTYPRISAILGVSVCVEIKGSNK